MEQPQLESTVIGDIYKGIDGSDRYLLVRRLDDDLTEEDVESHIFPTYYRRGNGSGTMFCTSYRYIQDPVHTNRAIVIIQNRYDV
jgi:hypothetical protein